MWTMESLMEEFSLSKTLPVILADALIQPLEGKTERKTKASKMVFNVWHPSLWDGIRVDANEFFWEFSMPCISHQTLFFSTTLSIIFIGSPLSFPLLTFFNRLFSLATWGVERDKSWEGRAGPPLTTRLWLAAMRDLAMAGGGRTMTKGWAMTEGRRATTGFVTTWGCSPWAGLVNP